MTNRILCLILALTMSLSLLGGTVWAAEDDLSADGSDRSISDVEEKPLTDESLSGQNSGENSISLEAETENETKDASIEEMESGDEPSTVQSAGEYESEDDGAEFENAEEAVDQTAEDDFSIKGEKGTAAESNAKDCGIGFMGTKPTPAVTRTLTATLVADTTSSLGHAFLVIRNDTIFDVYIGEYVLPSGEQATLGLRGGEPWLDGFGGAYINVEAFQAAVYRDFSYVTCVIDQEKLTKIANHYQKKSRYELDASVMVHNCTTAASEAWDLVCPPEKFITPINIPALLKKQMESSNRVNNAKKGTSLSGAGLVDQLSDNTKVFYMSKSGELTPLYLGEKLDYTTVKGKTDATSITLNWQPAKEVKNLYTRSKTAFGNGYVIYYKSAEDASVKEKFVQGLSTETCTLSGLKPGCDYSVQMFPAYQFVSDGKTAYSKGFGFEGTFTTNQITFNKDSVKLKEGKSTILATRVKGTTKDYPYFWGSTDPKVATVDTSGTIMAHSKGTATVSVSYGGSTATCEVTVTEPASVTLAKTSLTLFTGKSATLQATVQPEGEQVQWSSDNKKVATVDSKGKVTAKGAGNCTITATVDDVTATCAVTVKKPTIKLNKSSLTLDVKKTATLKATVTGPSKKVTWKSSKPKIATVDKNGQVKAKKAGKCTITATANGVKTTCKVNVPSKKDKAIEAYKKYLSMTPENYEFSIAYVDKDSIPDLMIKHPSLGSVSVSGDRYCYLRVYSYVNGRVQYQIYEMDDGYPYRFDDYVLEGSVQYYKKKGVMVTKYTIEPDKHTSDIGVWYHTFSKGKMEAGYLSKLVTKDGKTKDFSDKYLNSLTKKQFNQRLKKRVGSSKLSTAKFHKNTKSNRKKYLK